ncbi:MAG: alpha-xylosidase [Actinomycetaceae bacterium]|nr:alpha-xylosidase [Actinomycetaceae bacterium]MDY5272544.1 alpha-xylosidase [Arcanobacterium sp.]
MKFTRGYWQDLPGWTVLHPREIRSITKDDNGLQILALTRRVEEKGGELNVPALRISAYPFADGVIKIRIEHYLSGEQLPKFDIQTPKSAFHQSVSIDESLKRASVASGELTVDIYDDGSHVVMNFRNTESSITSSLSKAIGYAISPRGGKYLIQQLSIQPDEVIYGLGERFGPVAKNGQVIDLWNTDGGTATERAYKNVPFYLSSKNYGIFVNHSERVSYEIGSEVNSRVQFSVPGEALEYFVITAHDAKQVLSRYTQMLGRIPKVPAWSYGLWLSTSFKTDYSERKIIDILDRMDKERIHVSVLHFDCYWMRENHWCDFVWDKTLFPDPEGMLNRIHQRGIKVCVWINPYIARESDIFQEGAEAGYLLKKKDGAVFQRDDWQAGMALVDFTNPDAVIWYKDKLKRLLKQGVDCFKTDFGEEVPTDVHWYNGANPKKMHNYYSYLYNKTVYEAIVEVKGADEAIVFARSATAGSQVFPVHWGGDSEPTFASMAETLRGGLSFGLSGFGYWSHDMGGFEGKPDPEVFMRWYPFGIFSSHSRLHGSNSYRVPWLYGNEAVQVARRFTEMKYRLMPYILWQADVTVRSGVPMLRHMMLEYPEDRNCLHIDTQYVFGSDIIVAPVLSESGFVEYYLPRGKWFNVLDGRSVEAGWHKEVHDYLSLPLMVKQGTVLPIGNSNVTPVYPWAENCCFYLYGEFQGRKEVVVPLGQETISFIVERNGDDVTMRQVDSSHGTLPFSVCQVNPGRDISVINGLVRDKEFASEIASGIHISTQEGGDKIQFSYLSNN